MTIEEKMKRLDGYCDKQESCVECELRSLEDGCFDEDYPETVERAYNLVFPSSNVDHPAHYNNGNIECIDAMTSAFGKEAVGNFCVCNAFKYLWRFKNKNGIEDLDKAKWYMDKFKELTSNEETS